MSKISIMSKFPEICVVHVTRDILYNWYITYLNIFDNKNYEKFYLLQSEIQKKNHIERNFIMRRYQEITRKSESDAQDCRAFRRREVHAKTFVRFELGLNNFDPTWFFLLFERKFTFIWIARKVPLSSPRTRGMKEPDRFPPLLVGDFIQFSRGASHAKWERSFTWHKSSRLNIDSFLIRAGRRTSLLKDDALPVHPRSVASTWSLA